MQQYARIKSGSYGKHKIVDAVFPLVSGVARNPKGQLYVTINGEGSTHKGIEPRNCRIKVTNPADVEIVSEAVHESANTVVKDAQPLIQSLRPQGLYQRLCMSQLTQLSRMHHKCPMQLD